MVIGVCSIQFDPDQPVVATVTSEFGSRRPRGYVIGEENRLAQYVAETLEHSPPRYNPLVFCGSTGLGKSLLLAGFADRWGKSHHGSNVVQIAASDFAREYASHVTTDELPRFLARFRAADLLALDDVHHLANKPASQQALTLLLDDLLAREVLVLVTAKEPPGDSDDLLPPLASRLAAGLSVPLLPPSAAVCRVLLRDFATARELNVDDSVFELLLARADELRLTTLSQLTSTLLQIQCVASDRQLPLDATLVARVLDQQAADCSVSLAAIAAAACRYFKIKIAELKGPSRRRNVAFARCVAMYLARQLTSLSLQQIGHFLGRRDHTTVLHGCRKVELLLPNDASLAQSVSDLRCQLANAFLHPARGATP